MIGTAVVILLGATFAVAFTLASRAFHHAHLGPPYGPIFPPRPKRGEEDDNLGWVNPT
jgi:hypothetical protein